MVKVSIVAHGEGWKPVRWQELPTEFERDLARLIGVWTQELVKRAKVLAPVDSGKLRASINSRVIQRAGQILGIVGTNTHYAPMVEFGTGIYSTFPGAAKQPIKPKHGKALKIPIGRFGSIRALPGEAQAASAVGSRSVAAFIFRGSIKGQRPQVFLAPLLEDYTPIIQADIQRLMAKHGFR